MMKTKMIKDDNTSHDQFEHDVPSQDKHTVSQEEHNVTPVSSEVTNSQLQSGGSDTRNTVTHASDEVLVPLEKHFPDSIHMVTDSGSLQENTTPTTAGQDIGAPHTPEHHAILPLQVLVAAEQSVFL